MENGEDGPNAPKEKIVKVFRDFMTRIAKFDELVTVGSKLLAGFQQALGFLGRPSLEKSALLDSIMEAHGGKSLFHAEVRTCSLGLEDNIIQAKIVLTELACLLADVIHIVELTKEQDENSNHQLDYSSDSSNIEDLSSPSNPLKPVVDYATTMAIIYNMVEQDYTMQKKIVSSMFNSSQGELDTYCQMWTLRPYIDDGIMHDAWSHIR